MNKKETHHLCEEHLVEEFKSEGKVACEKCIKTHKLPDGLLGKEGQRCYWCNIRIRNRRSFGQAEFKIICEPTEVRLEIPNKHIVAKSKENIYSELFDYCVKKLGGRIDL